MADDEDDPDWDGGSEECGEDDEGPDVAVMAFEAEFEEAAAAAGLNRVCEIVIRGVSRSRIEIYQITTVAAERGKGYANKAMALLLDLADKHEVWVVLEAAANMDAADGGMTTEQLRSWYETWGFFVAADSMVRLPDDPEHQDEVRHEGFAGR